MGRFDADRSLVHVPELRGGDHDDALGTVRVGVARGRWRGAWGVFFAGAVVTAGRGCGGSPAIVAVGLSAERGRAVVSRQAVGGPRDCLRLLASEGDRAGAFLSGHGTRLSRRLVGMGQVCAVVAVAAFASGGVGGVPGGAKKR